MTTLITGATGFLGRAVVATLARNGPVVCAVRQTPDKSDQIAIADIGPDTDWRAALSGVTTVVHLAGLAHAKHDPAALMRVNAEGTANLVRQSRDAGVRRFVFVSSAKAAVDRTVGVPARETDRPSPQSAYGVSKLAAERAVLAESALSSVVLRPPLVFASDAKANFAALLQLAGSGAPLPFANLNNRRSLIARERLAEITGAVASRPDGPVGVFYVADAPAVSTPDIITALRRGMGKPPRMFGAPNLALGLMPAALRESLAVDDSALRAAYGEALPAQTDVREDLAATGAAWIKSRA